MKLSNAERQRRYRNRLRLKKIQSILKQIDKLERRLERLYKL